MPPSEIERLVKRTREGWSSGRSGPDLESILTTEALADDSALTEVLVADAEERAARGVPNGLAAYAELAPDIAERPAVARAVLMQVLASVEGPARRAAAAQAREAVPSLEAHIEVVLGLCEELADSFAVEAERTVEAQPGAQAGKYRLVERLGRGSFGEVWNAFDTELNRYVALKILYIDAARGEEATLERALGEARAAAALNHEHIVTVHAVGRLEDLGRFYIDSALVGDPSPTAEDPRRVAIGRSLESWPAGGVSAREAGRIMSGVCRGIAAAHARGVLHRDIKPANILMTPSGRALVADFGLSTTGLPPRRSDEEPHLQSVSMRSESGRRIVGTPAYMSPEQAAGERPTAASDIYSLGATLRFMLTGSPPFKPSGRFSDDARWDVIAQVRERREPEPLAAGGTPPVLAAICMRAMAAKPEDRYASALDMAEDLEAWLSDRPTRVLPPSTFGAAVLWCKRNPALAVVGSAAALAMTLGVAWYVVRVGAERDRAVAAERLAQRRLVESEHARSAAEATAEFLDGILASPDPLIEGKDVTVLSALNRSSAVIGQRLEGQEVVEAAVRTSIGHAYRALEDIKQARPHLDRALEIRARLLGADHRDTLKTRHESALVAALESRVEDAIVLMRGVVADSRRVLGDDHPATIEAIHDLGSTLAWSPRQETLTEALAAFEEAVARRTRLFGAEDRRTLSAMRSLAGVYYSRGEPAKAEPKMRELVEIHRRVSDPTDVERLTAVNDLGVILRVLDRHAEALPFLREAYDGLRAQLPPGHIHVLSAGISIAGVLNSLERGEEALAVANEIAAAADEQMGDENTFRWMTHIALANSYTTLGRFEEAEREALHAHAMIAKVIGAEARTARAAARIIVRLYERWNKPEEVERWKALAERTRPPADPGGSGK